MLDSRAGLVYQRALVARRSASGRWFSCPACPALQWLDGRGGQGNGETTLVQIFVRDNNVDQALKALKKKMQREGNFREMKRHVHYEKPSEKRARQQAEAVRRARKLARKRAQREGLLPAPKPRTR